MVEMMIRVCDLCDTRDGTEPYEVTYGDGAILTADLCPEHAKGLTDLRTQLDSHVVTTVTRKQGRRSNIRKTPLDKLPPPTK